MTIRCSGARQLFRLLSLLVCLWFPNVAIAEQAAVGHVVSFELDNGLQVVVIADHRVPIVTHMVWYRVGAIDDPQGSSGLAHLLEHMMFKSFDDMSQENFAETISRLGGIDNAVTKHDSTHYFQRVNKEHLSEVMALEARRMRGLKMTAEQIESERDVVREERRANVESDPIKLLTEEVMSALHRNHSYGRPPIGWPHEILSLGLEETTAAYEKFYHPGNAILVVAGDATPEEVRRLAEETYGKLLQSDVPISRLATREPVPLAARRVVLSDVRVPRATLFRYYLAPSWTSAEPGEAEALELLSTMLGAGESSLLHGSLVIEAKLAVAAGARYFGEGRDSGRLVLFALAGGPQLEDIETRLDAILDVETLIGRLTNERLEKAKAVWEAQYIFATDSQMSLATRYGEALAAGRSIADIVAVPENIANTTLDDVRAAARKFLDEKRSVTGLLQPQKGGDSR